MSALVTYENFLIVPKEMEADFVVKVLNGYYDTTMVGMKEAESIHLTSEDAISDEMVDMAIQLLGQTDPDDLSDTYSDDQNFGYYIHDIVLVMEKFKLSYWLERDKEWSNLPMIGVW